MPRHPRVHAQGLLYHVMARGNDGRKVFLNDSDYEAFLDGLVSVSGFVYLLILKHCGATEGERDNIKEAKPDTESDTES